MTDAQRQTLRELVRAAKAGEITPAMVGDWAFANGIWSEAASEYEAEYELGKLLGGR